MGEIADSMIYGEACNMCGVPLEDSLGEFPQFCSEECANDGGATIKNGYPEYFEKEK